MFDNGTSVGQEAFRRHGGFAWLVSTLAGVCEADCGDDVGVRDAVVAFVGTLLRSLGALIRRNEANLHYLWHDMTLDLLFDLLCKLKLKERRHVLVVVDAMLALASGRGGLPSDIENTSTSIDNSNSTENENNNKNVNNNNNDSNSNIRDYSWPPKCSKHQQLATRASKLSLSTLFSCHRCAPHLFVTHGDVVERLIRLLVPTADNAALHSLLVRIIQLSSLSERNMAALRSANVLAALVESFDALLRDDSDEPHANNNVDDVLLDCQSIGEWRALHLQAPPDFAVRASTSSSIDDSPTRLRHIVIQLIGRLALHSTRPQDLRLLLNVLRAKQHSHALLRCIGALLSAPATPTYSLEISGDSFRQEEIKQAKETQRRNENHLKTPSNDANRFGSGSLSSISLLQSYREKVTGIESQPSIKIAWPPSQGYWYYY